MLLTKRNEYALQAMIILARQKKGSLMSASDLAKTLKTSSAFMSKIAQQLTRAYLLESKRGKYGGLALAKLPEKILVQDVFNAIDGALKVSSCMINGRCKHHVCPIYPSLAKLQRELDENLNFVKLSTLA
jgi:Rrf2 family protein